MPNGTSTANSRAGRIEDARGHVVSQLDPVMLHRLHRHDTIPAEPLGKIDEDLDPEEIRRRPRALLRAPLFVIAWYAAFFGCFAVFSTWKGWDPVLATFAVLCFILPFASIYIGFRKARRARYECSCRMFLRHLHGPRCGCDTRSLPTAPEDGATICPVCGCAWRLDNAPPVEGHRSGVSDVRNAGGLQGGEEQADG